MVITESGYIEAGLSMDDYLTIVMRESGITGEELASTLECSVDELYQLLVGNREITVEHVLILENRYREATQAFVVGCQMMRTIQGVLEVFEA